MYHIHHTRGLILGSTVTGESNRFYKIFTEELGLVGAVAQSVREEKSKLRYVLQDLSWVTIDLVRGREVWRIISAGELVEYGVSIMKHGSDAGPIQNSKFKVQHSGHFARMCSLVLRLVHGEGREDKLFHDLTLMTEFLEKDSVNLKLGLAFEAIVALRILDHLGYLDGVKYKDFLYPAQLSTNLLEEFEKIRIATVPIINDALRSSQL